VSPPSPAVTSLAPTGTVTDSPLSSPRPSTSLSLLVDWLPWLQSSPFVVCRFSFS
jgi:hypothetical protein